MATFTNESKYLPPNSGCNVYGVAQLNETYYVICASTNLILVYNGSFFQQSPINVTDMVYPTDIAASHLFNCLYVCESIYVWRVNVTNGGYEIDRLFSVSNAYTLTVTADGRLVSSGYQQLRVFSQNGTLLAAISVSSFVEILSAAETKTGNYLMCEADRGRIWEITKTGTVVNSYGGQTGSGPEQLNWADYVLVDAITGWAFVADQQNHRVLLLDGQLREITQIYTGNNPWRLSWDHQTRILVSGSFGGQPTVFRVNGLN